MDNNNTIDMLTDIIALINSEDYDATIPNLAESCNVPIKFVRKCILRLIQNSILSSCINGEDPKSSDPDYSFMDEYLDNKENISTGILKGSYDHILWTIDLKVLDHSESQLLSLTPLQYSAIEELDESKNSFKYGAIYETKNNIRKAEKNERKNQDQIQVAIDSHSAISFNYKTKGGKIENHTGFPVNITTNVIDNWIYFELANETSIYRLDRVTGYVKSINSDESFPKLKEKIYNKYIWGSSFKENDKPVHVKLVISDTRSTLIQKIKNDIRHRKGIYSFKKIDSLYYYEDDIIGMPEFRRWLRSYGSSIQVIEPSYIRNEITEAAYKTLSYYQESENWKDL
ncbi:helix-turn-helix transcriptional regulator [Butyrivibrio fibrisolvens]|uniref:helix-turn-helix transcriptional regulator n=1 Tax=Butyrivibrio fibrisolvens TaxID=831 RepID=UPI00040AEEC4|nr:WYL domain-containing protein [Butyrivibrio fibrisolvens]